MRGWNCGGGRGEAKAKCRGEKEGEQGSSGAHGGRSERSLNENEGVLMVLGQLKGPPEAEELQGHKFRYYSEI